MYRENKIIILLAVVFLLLSSFCSYSLINNLDEKNSTDITSIKQNTNLSTVYRSKLSLLTLGENDNFVEWTGVLHDTRDSYYRFPGWDTTEGNKKTGAVIVGTNVTLRIRTVFNDLTGVTLRYWDGPSSTEFLVPMSINTSDANYDYWEAIIPSPIYPSDIYYVFILTDGTDTDYYNDDHSDSGKGIMYNDHNYGQDYGIIFYDPEFVTPDWHKQSIGYQIFPDRFFNGNLENDALDTDVTWWEWDSNGDEIFTSSDFQRQYAAPKTWDQIPSSTFAGDQFFGGDLEGVIQKSNYLSNDLGIDFIWFNPVAESPDNHGYAVDNYWSIDPYLGVISERSNGIVINNVSASLGVYDNMVSILEDNGIKVIFDTVINHASAQGEFFQRFENSLISDNPVGFSVTDPYPYSLGAYEDLGSQYSSWFNFYDFSEWNNDYDAWWGFKNIPTLKYDQTSAIEEKLITGSSSLFTFWDTHGVSGFRLDVNPDYDDGDGSRHVNQLIRDKVKANDPNDIIIGEVWDRANTFLTGTMNDGVQNMVFKDDTINWINGVINDERYIDSLLFFQENYPPEAFYSLWTLLGNHDTPRIINQVGSVDNVLLAATIQFSFPGVPVIYYGDEVGLIGSTDPDNRRPYPWGSEDNTMLNYYKTLIKVRNSSNVLKNGSLVFLNDDTEGIVTFARESPEIYSENKTISVFNRRDLPNSVTINLQKLSNIVSGDQFIDFFDETNIYEVSSLKTISIEMDGNSGKILFYKPKIEESSTSENSSNTETTDSENKKTTSFELEFVILSLTSLVSIKLKRRNLKKRY